MKQLLAMVILSWGLPLYAAEKIIPVRMYILTESNGQGNEAFRDNKYTDAMMKEINEKHYVSKKFELKLVSKTLIKNTRDYHSPQKQLRDKYGKKYDKEGEIVVIISREEKVDYNGIAAKQGVTYKPYFVMRSVRNNPNPKAKDYEKSAAAISTSAGLFVHEMAHMMNLRHQDSTSSKVHTENYTKVAAGKSIWENYLTKLASKAKAGYMNTSPAPAPAKPAPAKPAPIKPAPIPVKPVPVPSKVPTYKRAFSERTLDLR